MLKSCVRALSLAQWTIKVALKKVLFILNHLHYLDPRLERLTWIKVSSFSLWLRSLLRLDDCMLPMNKWHPVEIRARGVPGPWRIQRAPWTGTTRLTTGSFGRKRPGSQNRNRVPSLNSTSPSCSPGSYDVGEQHSNDRPGRNASWELK